MMRTQTEQRQQLADRAYELFREFRSAYTGEWQRLTNCERMYRGDHWHDVPVREPERAAARDAGHPVHGGEHRRGADGPHPRGGHRPETPEDAQVARVLEAVIRQNHDAACYAREYRRLVHDLLVSGYCVQEVGFDPQAAGGLGAAFIRHVDARSILFDPAATDLQDGRAGVQARPAHARLHGAALPGARRVSDRRRLPRVRRRGGRRAAVRPARHGAVSRVLVARIRRGGRRQPRAHGAAVRRARAARQPGHQARGVFCPRPVPVRAHAAVPAARLVPRARLCGHVRDAAALCRQARPDRAQKRAHGLAQQAARHRGVRLRRGGPPGLVQGRPPRREPVGRHVVHDAGTAGLPRGLHPVHPREHQAGERRETTFRAGR